MKRMHIHIRVNDLEPSKRFYSAVFGQQPNVEKADYAKWALDDPRVNLAISQRAGNEPGLDHLGIQAETDDELENLYQRLGNASYATIEQRGATCCYAESDKHWAVDPVGIAWEMFRTMAEATVYGSDRGPDVRSIAERGQNQVE